MGTYGGFTYKTPKKGLCDYNKYFPEISDDGVNDLLVMMEIVRNTHFLYIKDEFLLEDMNGAALVKMLEFIKSGKFDPDRGCLRNILYTVCRNEMKNVIYRNGRDFPVDDEVMGTNQSPHLTVSLKPITIEEVKIPRGADIDKVKASLAFLGFVIEGQEEVNWYPEAERAVAFAVWKKLRK